MEDDFDKELRESLEAQEHTWINIPLSLTSRVTKILSDIELEEFKTEECNYAEVSGQLCTELESYFPK